MFEKSLTGCNKRVIAFFALILLLSTFTAALHHHEKTADDHGCPVCIACNHHSATGPLVVASDGIPWLTETTFIASAPALADTLLSRSRSTRGPPA